MKIFKNKNIWKKLTIALLIILTFQIVATKPVHADVVQFGGKLMTPIMSLIVSLGDGLNDILASAIMGVNTTIFEVDMAEGFWEHFGAIILGVAAAALFVAAVVFGGGAIAAVVASITGKVILATAGISTLVAGAGVGIYVGTLVDQNLMPDDLYLPMYTYSAEEIFKNHILLFNVDFFGDDTTIKANLSDGSQIIISGRTEQEIQDELSKHKVTVEKTEHKGHVEVERTVQLKYQQLLILTFMKTKKEMKY